MSRAKLLSLVFPATLLLGLAIPAHRPMDMVMLPLQAILMGFVIYHLVLISFGMRPPHGVPWRVPQTRFAVLVAAHNEEAVIAQLIDSLHAQKYPGGLRTIFVASDHSTDGTAEVARRAGAIVYERNGQGRSGKGPAIEWLIRRVWDRGETYDAVVILDADNLVTSTFLRVMDAHLGRGDQVIQGYLGTKNPNDSWMTRAIYISYVSSNRFFQLAKDSIGLSSALGGTGLCIAMTLLRRLGWRCDALTEDLEFQIRAVLAGVRPSWGWNAVVYDEKPLTLGAAWRQRRRWMEGHAQVAFRYLGRLVVRAARSRDPILWDAAVYLANPLWLTMVLLLLIMYGVNQIVPLFTYLYPVWLPPTMIAASLLLPYLALRVDGVSGRLYYSPSTLLAHLLLSLSWPLLGFLGVLHFRNRHWVKTTHTRSLSMEESRREQAVLSVGPVPSLRSGLVRSLAVAATMLTVIALITPHLTARRLRPQLEASAELLLNGETARAIAQFESAAAEDPKDPIVHGFLALSHKLAGHDLRAWQAYLQAKRLDPRMGNTVVAIVDFLLRHRSHPRTEHLLQAAMGIVRSGPQGYAWVANHFIDRGRVEDAEFIIGDGVRRFGNQVPFLKVQGYLHYMQRRYLHAVRILTEAHRKVPRDPAILINLGWAHFRLSQYAEAAAVWERALALDPNNQALRRDLEWVKRHRG